MAGAGREHLESLVLGYSNVTVARGRAYAAEGRVVEISDEGAFTRAVVRGSRRYDVELGPATVECSCPAYAHEGECKHVAAVAFALRGERQTRLGVPPLPGLFRDVYATGAFLSRFALHAGRPLDVHVEAWLPLGDWWRRGRIENAGLRELVLAHTNEVAEDIETLRTFDPPPCPLPGTAYGALYEHLAKSYRSRRENVRIRRAAPGPLRGGRHPGFVFGYNKKKGEIEASEKTSALLRHPMSCTLKVPRGGNDKLELGRDYDSVYGSIDAWDLWALGQAIVMLAERTEQAAQLLEQELGKPVWEHVLEQLGESQQKAVSTREWGFALASAYGAHYAVQTFARTDLGNRMSKWRRQPLATIYGEEAGPLEHEIARVALASTEKNQECYLRIGAAQGHELLRALARHGNVRVSERRPDLDADPRAEIVAGTLTMRLEEVPNGNLAPRFALEGREVSPAMLSIGDDTFRGAIRGNSIFSAFVPPTLRSWVELSRQMGDALTFPPEAVSKLVETTQPLVDKGFVEVPRKVLGAELPLEARVGLRVDWRMDGGAVIEPMISPHPAAPLATPGAGAELFTFVDAGRRVFVERDLESEVGLVEEVLDKIDVPITWDNRVGRTESFEDAIALADWLDRNPLGLAIEVKLGQRPKIVTWGSARRTLHVSAEGAWLRLDGEIETGDVKLTVGDVLEAARLARRYVRAKDGLFLELSKEAIARLQPVALAAELGEGDGDKIHQGFASVLSEVEALFERVHGVDLGAYARKFEARTKASAVPKLERGKLRGYQREGALWMLGLSTWAPGCVLADDMGLGKTIMTASVLKARRESGPALIVAPASVSSNWMSELARFMPSLRTRWYNEDRRLDDIGPGDVVVASYGLVQRDSAQFQKAPWSSVVIDEAQYVKNVGAQRTDAVRGLSREFTICLTGTPLENHLGELYSIVELAFPGLLGGEAIFRERFRRPIEGRGDTARLETLGRLLAPFLLRRTRKMVLRELPPREEVTELIELGPEERKRYLALRQACEEQFSKRKRGETPAQLKIALLAALTRLRQLACDVRLVDHAYDQPGTKIGRAIELCQQTAAEGNKTLVFSQFTQFLEKVRDALARAGLRVAYLAGDTPTAKRRAIVEAFQDGEFDVFCVSLLAGGTGLNLTRASYVIHLDPWWNPAAEEQATSRSHRMGQDHPVTVYKLVARGTIEEAVLEMQAKKRDLASAVLSGKADAAAITPSELLDLLRFG